MSFLGKKMGRGKKMESVEDELKYIPPVVLCS